MKTFLQGLCWMMVLVSHAASGAPAQDAASVQRAQVVRQQLLEHRHFGGGHSPWPSRVINADTLAAVRPGLHPSDAPALVELTLDPQAQIRAAAIRLLFDVTGPQSEQYLQERLARETLAVRRQRLEQALIEVRTLSVAGP